MKFTELKRSGRKEILFSVAEDEGGALCVGTSEGKVLRTDPSGGSPDAVFQGEAHASYVTGLARAGSILISGSYDRHLVWWDGAGSRQLFRKSAHDKWIRKVTVSPDGKTVATVADDMVCRLWDAGTGALKAELRGHAPETPDHYPSMLFTCAFNPAGDLLATADKVGRIIVWNAATGAIAKSMDSPGMYTWDPIQRRHSIGGVRSLAFSPDGRTLVAGGIGKIGNIDHLAGNARLEVFDWASAKSLAVIETGQVKGLVNRLAFHPEGKWLLGAGGDHKGLHLLVNCGTWKLELEEPCAFHVHDFVLSPTADRYTAVGHQGICVQAIA